jgi:hypothetical protein
MAPKFKSEGGPDLNEWAESGLSIQDIAANFADHYLQDQLPGEGCYAEEYYPWLDSVMEVCPPQAFPVTEEPIPGGPYDFGETIEFYGAEDVRQNSNILRPPGLSKMLEPEREMVSAIAWGNERAKAKEPSGFQKWNLRHKKT